MNIPLCYINNFIPLAYLQVYRPHSYFVLGNVALENSDSNLVTQRFVYDIQKK